METITRRRRQSGESCDCLRPLIRFWGITTAIVVCGVGVDIAVHGYKAGIFILIGSGVILFLEVKWVVTLFVQLLFAGDSSSNCVRCWSICRIPGGWRISPLYIAFGIALIFWPHNLWLSYVAGAQLIILAIFRLCTIFRFNGNTPHEFDSSSNCVRCWSICRIPGGWRISPLYIAFGIALIFWPHNLWLSYVAGAQLIILAIFRLCTIFRFNGNTKGEGLLPQYDDVFDKSDIVSDAVDDSFPEACQNLEDEEAIDEES